MKRRQWSPAEKLAIVLEVLEGNRSLSEVCNHHQISQAQYYQWRDRLKRDGHKIFVRGGVDKQTERLAEENKHLKTIIGDLVSELKKNDF